MAKETTFGTPVAATTFLPMTGCTLEEDPGWFSPQLMMATRDLQVFNMQGEAKFSGSIDGPMFPSNAIELLVAAIGTDAVTGTAAPYTHTLSQANTLPSLTVEKNVGDFQSLQFAGCRVGKYSLKCAAGNSPAAITVDVSGQSVLPLATPTVVDVINEIPFVFAEGLVTLFGNARAEVSSTQLDIDNGLKETYTYSGAHGPSFITPVTLHVSGTIDLVWDSFDDSTYGDFQAMDEQTLGALDLKFAHPGAAGDSIDFSCPQVVLAKYSNDVKMTDVVMSTLTFEASKELTDGHTIQAIVKNSVQTAY